jgi:phosphatidylethanolamine/phosphatidyl-N-methylethanolamine N-methyltransferase
MRQGVKPAGQPRATAAHAATRHGLDEGIGPRGGRQPAIGQAARDSLAFLRGFLQHPDQVGSVIPSSSFLEARLIRCAGLHSARCVVELGPGTGGTTRAFLRALPATAHLLTIELSPTFHARISSGIRDPRLTTQLGSAEQIEAFLDARRLPAPDAVISGIPFSTMPAEVADRVAAAVAKVLAPGGRFVAYQVRAHVARYATPYLGEPAQQWEWLNIPPVRVFTWQRPLDPSD